MGADPYLCVADPTGRLPPLWDGPLRPGRDSDHMNTVGEPYSGKPNVRFDEGRPGRRQPNRPPTLPEIVRIAELISSSSRSGLANRPEVARRRLTADPADQLIDSCAVQPAHDALSVDDQQRRDLPVEVLPFLAGGGISVVDLPHPAADAQGLQVLVHHLRLRVARAAVDDRVHFCSLIGTVAGGCVNRYVSIYRKNLWVHSEGSR